MLVSPHRWYNVQELYAKLETITDMDAMTKMWVSLIGIGLMALSAVAITFARLKTKGFVRGVLSLIAFLLLMIGFLLGLISIL